MRKSKLVANFADAVGDIPDGATIAIGGFSAVGTPFNLIKALREQGAKGLTCIVNATGGGDARGVPDPGLLITNGQLTKVICSFTAATRASVVLPLTKYYEAGLIEAELVPQGTLAERLRAAGAGIPAFYTPAAVGTELADGRETRRFNGRDYLLEYALPVDYAFVRAHRADAFGNLQFRLAQRNFNPLMAMAAKVTIVEVEEEVVPVGGIDPDHVHTSGIFVHRLVQLTADAIWQPPPLEVAR